MKKRGLLKHFQIKTGMPGHGNRMIIDRKCDPGRVDFFCEFRGHSKPEDNGFLWISITKNPANPALAQQAMDKAIQGLGNIAAMELILPGDQLIGKSDQVAE